MNYLRNLKAKAKVQSLALPSLADILTSDNNEQSTETQINSHMTTLKDSLTLPATSGQFNEFLDNLKLISNHLPLILIKWRRATQFGQILFSLPWRNCIFGDPSIGLSIVEVLLEILSDMMAISPNFIQPLIKNIILRLFQGADSEGTELSSSESQLFERCHIFLKDLVETYPSASLLLSNSFKSNFPHYITSNVHCYVAYLTNMMTSMDYVTETHSVLNLLVDKLIWLEMSAQRAAVENQEETSNGNTTTSPESSDNNNKTNMDLALKCHSIFDTGFHLFLTKIHTLLHPNSLTYDPVKADSTINSLLYIFTTQVINIESLINLPFALVYWSSFTEDLCERTLSELWYATVNSFDKGSPFPRPVCVLASLMVEASFITTDQVIAFLEIAVNWCLDYSDACDDVVIDAKYNPEQHRLFYSVTQSIFYLISCKINDLKPLQLKSIRFLNLQGLIGSKLNPLLYCLPTIVDQFVENARDYQIALCSHVIDRNLRLGLDISSFFNHSLIYYFPFNSYTFQAASHLFDPILCYSDGPFVFLNCYLELGSY